ncbi:MAG: acetylornithine aminotransferase, partial [Segetibacter sp.]|nr:acetylornithine aminotransferase [Segetibacter sp.]
LNKHRIFTGEAKPNVIRVLPSLAIKREQVDAFLSALQNEIASLNATSANTKEAVTA